MKRVALVLLLVVAVVATIVFALRGHDVAPGDSSSRATEVVATGTVGRGPPRSRSAKSEPEPPPATRRIAGVVVDAMSRDPIAGAAVLVARRRTPVPGEGFVDTELPGEPEFRATTSAEGSFGVDVPADGPWFVTARAPDCADAIVLASVGDDLRLRLARGVEKTFTVRRMVDRAPIAGAEIWVYGRDGSVGPPQLRCVTDEHGEARIRVAADDECLVVRAKGYARADRITSATDLLLVPGSWITGVVRDRAGHAVAGAVLRIDERAWLSDRDGRFVLDEIPTGRDGRQLVEVKADAFAPWSGRLHCGDADAVVELSRIGAVVGTVVLPDGSPAVDAEVTNWTAYSIRSSIDVERRRTDAAGAFRVAAWAGPQSVSAKWRPDGGHAADETFGAAEVEVPDGGTVEGVVIRLTPKSFVPLRIVDAAGRAVTDVLVRAKVPDDFEVRGDLVLVSVEQPAGAAVDLSLCDGSTRGSRWQGVHVAATTQASADGPAVEVRLPVLRELTVTILAADGSGLPASALSSLGLHSESGEEMQATSEGEDVSKTWMVDPARRYVIFVEAERLASIGRVLTPEEIASGRVAVRLDAGVTVRGLIVAADPDAVIGVFLVAADLDRAGMVVLDVVRDADGRFHVDHVAPGTWRLVVRGPQFTLLAERQVRVAGEADVDVGEIELPARVWLHGAVRTPDGGPCGGAVIQNVRNDDDFRFTPSVVSQSDGSFDVYVPTTGRGALLVRRHGFGAAVARLDGVDLASRLDVRLSAEGTLDIRIRLPRPGAEFDWYVQTPDGAVRWQPTEAAANDVPGFDRHIVCPGLAPGPLVVEISSPRSTLTPWKHTANVIVVAGETTTVVVGPER